MQNEKGNVEDAWTTTSATFPFLICSTSSPNTFNKQEDVCVWKGAVIFQQFELENKKQATIFYMSQQAKLVYFGRMLLHHGLV